MLIPLTRKKFETLVPVVATGAQYAYYWGKLQNLLRRILISVVGIFVVILFIYVILPHQFDEVFLLIGIVVGLYWLWGPVLWASLRNLECRRYGYCGFWQGEVLDVYITEELIGTEENVNNRGDLVVVENRERCLNLELGDEAGFLTRIRVPIKRAHRAIDVGDVAELLVFSHRGDLGRIANTSDVYIPDHNLWVSDYPYVQREEFIDVSRRLSVQLQTEKEDLRSRPEPSRSSSSRQKRIPKTGANSQPGSLARREPSQSSSQYRDRPPRGDYRQDNESDYSKSPSRRRRSSSRRPDDDW